ncbi:MAG: hypothetical protein ABIK92_04195 [Pseudomonadota bacterium]
MSFSNEKELEMVFKYPLFEALAHRRTRRFPLGGTLAKGLLQHSSQQEPLPLNDLETALLCWAGAGINGTVTGDSPTDIEDQGTAWGTWVGRTVPAACNVQNTKIFFTNDTGTFLYNPQKATKAVEIETEKDRQKIMNYFKNDCVKLFDGRAEFIPAGGYGATNWNIGKPGTTVFMPIVDQSEEYLNVLFVLFQSEGYKIINDLKGGEPAGIGKWIEKGAIKGPEVPFSSFEFNALMINIAPVYAMLQNISLAAEAMGLGQVVFAGHSGVMMLGITPFTKGLGFRSAKTKDGNLNAVGLDGIFQPYCPPYYKDMGEAVDAFVEKKFGHGGIFDSNYPGAVPFKDDKEFLAKYEKPSSEVINIVKDYANYVYDNYGRFPGTFDTILLRTWIQVHHLDLEFYDKHMVPGLINDTHRSHMKHWHK